MTTRERNRAALLIGLILLGTAAAAGYAFVYDPLQEKAAAAAKLEQEVAEAEGKLAAARLEAPRLAAAKRRSLPADENLARREYNEALSRLLRRANVPLGYKVTERTSNATGTPLLAPKKPAYTKVVYDVTFDRADLWAVQDFLAGYYRLDLLHQITAVEVVRKADAGAGSARKVDPDRKDLSVKLTTEAILLDGADARRTLLPVSNAFAAVGGLPGYHAVALSPEVARGLTPAPLAPALAAPPRDYSLVVLRDIFHGPLPPPPPLRLGKMADVAVEVAKPVPPVRVPVVADVGYTGRVTLTATAEGKLLPEGAVTIDQTGKTVTLAPAAGETGTATVTVVARADNGEEARASFKLSVKEPPAAERPAEVAKEDISAAVILIAVSTRSDGTAFAVVRDNFNPLTYEIEVDADGVRVTKYEYIPRKKKDRSYDTPALLAIADENVSGTKRTFRVVAIDDTGLVLAEANPAGVPAKGGRGAGLREKPADPLDAVVGAAAGAGRAAPPVLVRWASGKSLAALTEVPADEAKRILRRAAETGPVGATAVAASRD